MSDSDTTRDSLPSINTALSDLSVNAQTTSNNNKPTTSTDGKAKAKKGLSKTSIDFYSFEFYLNKSFLHFSLFTVDILLNATGNVPILKTRKWAVEADKPVSSIIRFIHKYLKLDPEEKLVSYISLLFERKSIKKNILFPVFICKPDICTITRPNSEKSI